MLGGGLLLRGWLRLGGGGWLLLLLHCIRSTGCSVVAVGVFRMLGLRALGELGGLDGGETGGEFI